MADVGRPSKISDDKIKTAIKLAEENKTITYICKFLEITRPTFYNWAINTPELKQRVDEEKKAAELKELEQIKKSLVKRAKGYKTKEVKEIFDGKGTKTGEVVTIKEIPADVKAQQFFLTNRAPEEWKLQPDNNPNGLEDMDNTINIKIID